MSRMSVGPITVSIPDLFREKTYVPQGFGEEEAICGERCPYPDKPKCGARGCSFYKEEVKKIKKKRNTVS